MLFNDKKIYAEKICNCILSQTVDYSVATNSPEELSFDICIWTALFYSVADILEQNFIKDAVAEQFIREVCKSMHIPLSDEAFVSHIKDLHFSMLRSLRSENVDPITKSGVNDILEFAYIFGCDSDDSYDALIGPSTNQMLEFLMAVNAVREYTMALYPAKINEDAT